MQTPTSPSHRLAGFTLIELMVVIAIIALLASLTIGAFQYAQASSSRNRTTATQAALSAGLERYNAEFGEFPTPANPDETEDFGGTTYKSGGALMLYQAMSGDGDDGIELASGGSPSNGRIDDDEEGNIMMNDMPDEIWIQVGNRYYITDGWRKPFQYTNGKDENAVNPTYDLWSYGEDQQNTQLDTQAAKTNAQQSGKWITNW